MPILNLWKFLVSKDFTTDSIPLCPAEPRPKVLAVPRPVGFGVFAPVRELDDVGEVDRAQKIEFLSGLHVLSVPTTYREPKGLYVLEALANGVPVVQPRHGAFPELIERTGGGELVTPGDIEGLARSLRGLMDDPGRRQELGRRGKQAVHSEFRDDRTARNVLNVYREYVDNRAA